MLLGHHGETTPKPDTSLLVVNSVKLQGSHGSSLVEILESHGICFWMPFLLIRSCDFEEKSFVEFDEIDEFGCIL